MPTDPIPVLTLLAKLYEEQSQLAWNDGQDKAADFYAGGCAALRAAMLIIIPTSSATKPRVTRKGAVVGVQAGDPNPAHPPLAPPPPIPPAPPAVRKRNGQFGCPECSMAYNTQQHLGLHRKKTHGVPSLRDRAAMRNGR